MTAGIAYKDINIEIPLSEEYGGCREVEELSSVGFCRNPFQVCCLEKKEGFHSERGGGGIDLLLKSNISIHLNSAENP